MNSVHYIYPMKLSAEAVFQAARTTTDGGWRVSFDLSEDEAKFVTDLNRLKGHLLYLCVMNEEEINGTTNTDNDM